MMIGGFRWDWVRAGRKTIFAIAAAVLLASPGLAQEDSKPPKINVLGDDSAKQSVAPFTPPLPGPIVAAMQDARYAEAISALDGLIASSKEVGDKSFYRLIRGTALKLADQPDEARKTWKSAIDSDAKGTWANKIRAEWAALELSTGHPDVAEALVRSEVEVLLAVDRKDRLAEVYRDFAKRLLNPSGPTERPNPVAAHAMLSKARELAKSPALQASLLFAMGLAAEKADDPGGKMGQNQGNRLNAAADFSLYIRDYPQGADRFEARYHLGDAQLASQRLVEARATWTDLARDLAGEAAANPARADLRARSLYAISRTYSIPQPPDATNLNLGVAALKRFLAEAPGDPRSVKAAYEIGESYLSRGQADRAIAAFNAFLKGEGFRVETEAAKKDRAELAPRASYKLAQATLGLGKYDEAISLFNRYLAEYPAGEQSADARRAILDAHLQAAQEAFNRENYEAARARWLAFASDNPLDDRVPQLLYRVGEAFGAEKRWDDAIKAWDRLAGQFPNTEPAAHAQFQAAATFEDEKEDPEAAIDRFRKVAGDQNWVNMANQRVAVMEAKALTVVTPRTFRSGETAHLQITSRNIEKLTFSAYRLNPEAFFRKKHSLDGVSDLDVGLVAPDSEWTMPVARSGRYHLVENNFDLKVNLPGVYVVKVSDEKSLQATALVVGSDLDAIVKMSPDQVLVYVQDAKAGRGRKGARVLLANESNVVFEATTGDDGVLLQSTKKPEDAATPPNSAAPGSTIHCLVIDGDNVAGTMLGVPNQVAQGLTPLAYIDTDRPAYRPGQEVKIRGVVRESGDGQYVNPAGQSYRLEVFDGKGRRFLGKEIKLSAFGTLNDSVPLDDSSPVGTYLVVVSQPGKSRFTGTFEVKEYRLEKMTLDFDLPKTVYYRGEIVKGICRTRYGYDAPAEGRSIVIRLPDGRLLRGKTDGKGEFAFEFPTESYGESQTLGLVARLDSDNVAAAAKVRVAVQGFSIGLTTPRDVYLDGEAFRLAISTADASGKPVGRPIRVATIQQVTRNGRVTEREVANQAVTTSQETGQGSALLSVNDDDGGPYVIRATGTDQFDNPIVADLAVTVSGKKDDQRLRFLADRTGFKMGETGSLRIVSRIKAGATLIAWEADRILQYRLVDLKEGENPLTWPVGPDQFPNLTLTATRMVDQALAEARIDVTVERDLRITLVPRAKSVDPGSDVEVDVVAVDQLGRPAQAEVALSLVDQALLRQFADRLPPIGPFFYNQRRLGAFATASTNGFVDRPTTIPVAEALVEEDELKMAKLANESSREAVMNRLGEAVNAPAAAPAAPEAAAEAKPSVSIGAGGMGGMGGGMGGMGMQAAGRGALRDEQAEFAQDAALPSDKKSEASKFDRSKASADAPARSRMAQVVAPREQVVETAYWNPSVVTDAEGKATVRFKAPAALSEYRLKAQGVTGADTLVGQSTATLLVRKDFYVELRAPALLIEGDKPRFLARVHHVGLPKGLVVQLKLETYAGEDDRTDPKTLTIASDGVDEVYFEPFSVPDAEAVRLKLSAVAGEKVDEVAIDVPVRPWGLRAVASASGTSKDDRTVSVGLPAGRRYDDVSLRVDLAPSLNRLVIELALGQTFRILRDAPVPARSRIIWPPYPDNTTADHAADLTAVAAALEYLKQTRSVVPAEASRLQDRGRNLVAGLIAEQNDDGGWPWASAGQARKNQVSHRLASATAAWALREALLSGIEVDPSTLDRAANYLANDFNRAGADVEGRAAVLASLAHLGRATFEQANTLNRTRQNLADVSLAHLAIAFGDLDRPGLAAEVIAILNSRVKVEPVGPGLPPRKFWAGTNQGTWTQGAVETTAVVAQAIARVQPSNADFEPSVEYLMAHRNWAGWTPHKAKGSALSAVAAFYGKAGAAQDRYRLVVTVNDAEVGRLQVDGAMDGHSIVVPNKVLKVGTPNVVRFDIEGRGTFGYSATIEGFARDFIPEQERQGRRFTIQERDYLPSLPELDGKVLPTGFSSVINPETFVNKSTQVLEGGRIRVDVSIARFEPSTPTWNQPFLILEESMPAGVTLVEDSISTSAGSFTTGDNVIYCYFAPENGYPRLSYEVAGYLPGDYRALPSKVSNAYDPGSVHVGKAGSLSVLPPKTRLTDPYRPTPDEMLARGKALAEAGNLAGAAEALEPLLSGYTPKDEVARDVARILLSADIKDYQARKVVRDFEILKEKGPDVVIPFDEVLVVGKAYRDIGEFERAFLVFRALAEASYLEDAQVGELIRQQGRNLEALTYLLKLWRESPGSASIEADLLGLSQVLTDLADRAINDPSIRDQAAKAGVTRSELLLQSIRVIQTMIALSPRTPLADEASLALLTDDLNLEDFETVIKLAPRFAKLYPSSKLFDSFQFAEVVGRFQLGQFDRAVEVARAIEVATYPDPNGVAQPSPNKWEAVYILGQIFDARRQPARALEYYRQVAGRFTDAADAAGALSRKALKLPEVSIIRPGKADAKPTERDVTLDYRNIAEADVKVYPVDLMRLYLTRRNLDEVAGIDLAGITPLHQSTVKLGDGLDFAEKSKVLDLPLTKEGAYLVMVRGDDLYASGIVLVSPIEMEVTEEAGAGRVRVVVRDASTKDYVSKAQVKVIGSGNQKFSNGSTDLRGVSVAEGIVGEVTAVARKGNGQYAFYRGTTQVGQTPRPAGQPQMNSQAGKPLGRDSNDFLYQNIRGMNSSIQSKGVERLQGRFNDVRKGVRAQEAR